MKRAIGNIWAIVLLSVVAAGRIARAEFVAPSDFDFKSLLPAAPERSFGCAGVPRSISF